MTNEQTWARLYLDRTVREWKEEQALRRLIEVQRARVNSAVASYETTGGRKDAAQARAAHEDELAELIELNDKLERYIKKGIDEDAKTRRAVERVQDQESRLFLFDNYISHIGKRKYCQNESISPRTYYRRLNKALQDFYTANAAMIEEYISSRTAK